MTSKILPSAERVRELLSYDPETGSCVWRVSRNGCKVGGVAGSLRSDGYLNMRIDGRSYLAHRVAFLYIHGIWPTNQIDHIDRIKSNNRIDNLREATVSENGQNRHLAQSNNRSCGLLGVTWHKGDSKWMAQLCVDGKRNYLGSFALPEEAHAAYLRAKNDLHPFSTLPHLVLI